MDFKTKTALCIARLYNSSACVFWLAQTPKKELNNWKMVTGVVHKEVVFSLEYLAFELGQAFPGHLSHPELAAAALPAASSSCGHSWKVLPAGGTTLEQLLHAAPGSAEQWEILRGCELSPGECAACSGAQGSPGLALAEGALPRAGQQPGAALAPHRAAPRAPQDRTWQAQLPKQSAKGIAQQTCAYDKRKIESPLLSLNRILTWCFRNTSELFAITNLSIQHL